MNVFSKIFYSLRLRAAIQMADKYHERTGERYYVLPSTERGIKLVIIDRHNFRKMKAKGYINRNANVMQLSIECFYATPYVNGNGYMPDYILKEKKKQFFQWVTEKKKRDKKHKKHGTVR